MKVVTMTCPGTCGKRYKITISDKEFATGSWTCPECGYTAPFRIMTPPDKGVPLPPPPGGNVKTTIFGNGNEKAGSPLTAKTQFAATQWVLKIVGTNAIITLPAESGQYVMGRNSGDSTAAIKVAPDKSISREHAMLYIKNQAGNFTFSIMGLKEYNPVIINNKILPARKIVLLQENATIKLGKVTLQLTKKQG